MHRLNQVAGTPAQNGILDSRQETVMTKVLDAGQYLQDTRDAYVLHVSDETTIEGIVNRFQKGKHILDAPKVRCISDPPLLVGMKIRDSCRNLECIAMHFDGLTINQKSSALVHNG